MYPLNAILVGCNEGASPQVRRELERQTVRIETECPDVAHLVKYERMAADRPERSALTWTGGAGRQPKRRLYVMHLKAPQDFRELQWLSSTLAGQPILALMEGADEKMTVIQAMREGASQVVMLPLESDDFEAALNRIAQQFRTSASEAKVFAVSGINGGCGATTVAINLAYEMAHLHQIHCLLAELSPQMGAFATYLNVQPQYTITDLFRDLERQGAYAVQKALTHIADNLDILAGPHEAIDRSSVTVPEVMQLIECTRRLAEVVILDVPCTFDALYFETLAAADQIVLVAEQKVLSMRTLKLLRDALARSPAPRPQHLVINRYDPKLPGLSVAELERLLDVPKMQTISNDGTAVNAALNHGRPLRLETPHSPVLADLDALARTLLNIGAPTQAAKGSGLFGQLRRAISRK